VGFAVGEGDAAGAIDERQRERVGRGSRGDEEHSGLALEQDTEAVADRPVEIAGAVGWRVVACLRRK